MHNDFIDTEIIYLSLKIGKVCRKLFSYIIISFNLLRFSTQLLNCYFSVTEGGVYHGRG